MSSKPRSTTKPELLRAFWKDGDFQFEGPEATGRRVLYDALCGLGRDAITLLQRLEAAGYDTTSLRVSIARRPRESWVAVYDGDHILVLRDEDGTLRLPGGPPQPEENGQDCATRMCLAQTWVHPDRPRAFKTLVVRGVFVTLYHSDSWEGSLHIHARWVPIAEYLRHAPVPSILDRA